MAINYSMMHGVNCSECGGGNNGGADGDDDGDDDDGDDDGDSDGDSDRDDDDDGDDDDYGCCTPFYRQSPQETSAETSSY